MKCSMGNKLLLNCNSKSVFWFHISAGCFPRSRAICEWGELYECYWPYTWIWREDLHYTSIYLLLYVETLWIKEYCGSLFLYNNDFWCRTVIILPVVCRDLVMLVCIPCGIWQDTEQSALELQSMMEAFTTEMVLIPENLRTGR